MATKVKGLEERNGIHKPEQKEERVVITEPNVKIVRLLIRGTSPLVINKFSRKARQTMKEAQEAGPQAKKGRKREPKNFEQCYRDAMHLSADGWQGIAAPAFRNAMIDACRLAGFKMTHSRMGVFVEADGIDADDGTPLVRITKGEPQYAEHAVRNESGVADIRPRPMWLPGWEAIVTIKFDADMFSATDVTNLLARAGLQVGVGEGRPFSKNSNGMGWGMFQVFGADE